MVDLSAEQANLERGVLSTAILSQHFDAVVMLTWSNWRTEPRSNRYHYATRFARTLPVLFVQLDGTGRACSFEPTEIPGITIVHLPPAANTRISLRRQGDQLSRALTSRGVRRPLLWIYNVLLEDFVSRCYAPLKVYHATEDYFSCARIDVPRERLIQVVRQCDLVVAVSNGVADSYRQHTHFEGPIQVAPNGCDYETLAAVSREVRLPPPDTSIALFQGGINWRVDFELLNELATLLPDWEFHFCGQQSFERCDAPTLQRWNALQERPNVHYLGYLSADETARAVCHSTIGLIPFVRERTIVEHSLPLKAFEYVACGLPVVSIPIRELASHADLFALADSAHGFADHMVRLRASRWEEPALRIRAEQASRQSYETNFAKVGERMIEILNTRSARRDRLNVLILFDQEVIGQSEARQQLEAFQIHSRQQVLFLAVPRSGRLRFDLALFDAIVIHGSLLEGDAQRLPVACCDQLKATPGFKAWLPMTWRVPGHEFAAWCSELGLQGNSGDLTVPGSANLCSADAFTSVVAAWDDWLEAALPRSRGFRLRTVLASFESPRSQGAHAILDGFGSLAELPGNTVRPFVPIWNGLEDWAPKFYDALVRSGLWLRNVLAWPVRRLRRAVRS